MRFCHSKVTWKPPLHCWMSWLSLNKGNLLQPFSASTRESENSWLGLRLPCLLRRLTGVAAETMRLSTQLFHIEGFPSPQIFLGYLQPSTRCGKFWINTLCIFFPHIELVGVVYLENFSCLAQIFRHLGLLNMFKKIHYKSIKLSYVSSEHSCPGGCYICSIFGHSPITATGGS